MRTITSQQAQSIVDIACTNWKEQLYQKWGKDIVFKKSINISEADYETMRSECTRQQHELFDEIFGKDATQYKVGDWVLTANNAHGWGSYADNINNKILQITAIDRKYNVCPSGKFFFGKEMTTGKHIIRLATPEEIKKAQYLPDGTPCFVRLHKDMSWRLAYATGNGGFYINGKKKSNATTSYTHVRKYSDGLPEE
jgi:hypothetical protein